MMAVKIKWADVVVGKDVTRYTVGDGSVEDIKLDPQSMAMIVFFNDGILKSYFGCPYVLCQEDASDIVVPEIVLAS
jgi:hypothetical protein